MHHEAEIHAASSTSGADEAATSLPFYKISIPFLVGSGVRNLAVKISINLGICKRKGEMRPRRNRLSDCLAVRTRGSNGKVSGSRRVADGGTEADGKGKERI